MKNQANLSREMFSHCKGEFTTLVVSKPKKLQNRVIILVESKRIKPKDLPRSGAQSMGK